MCGFIAAAIPVAIATSTFSSCYIVYCATSKNTTTTTKIKKTSQVIQVRMYVCGFHGGVEDGGGGEIGNGWEPICI